jgi:hypothetical protein
MLRRHNVMSMARTFLLLIIVSIATPLFAAEPAEPDYSRDAIFRFAHDFVNTPHSAFAGFNLDHLGEINVFKFGVRGHFNYLPFLAPLPGTRLVDVATVPNAFALTNTVIARSMPYMPDETSLSPGARRELKRAIKVTAE